MFVLFVVNDVYFFGDFGWWFAIVRFVCLSDLPYLNYGWLCLCLRFTLLAYA